MTFSVENYLAELAPLINVDCGSLNQAGIAQVAELLAQKYSAMGGWDIKRVDCGAAGVGLEIRNQPANPQIDVMLIGHMDTVFPVGTVAARPMSHDGVKAYGPGVSDMKSGLLNIVYALRALDPAVRNKLSLCICMNPDEEIGSTYSAEWLASVAKNAKQVLVAEAARADGSLVKARKGMARYRIEFTGKAAHAGNDPQAGRSAITELAHWVLALNSHTNFDTGTTLNVGTVSGGTGSNIVPANATAVVDVRFWDNADFAALHAALTDLATRPHVDGVKIALVQEAHKPAMVPSAGTESLMALVEICGADMNLPITWQAVGGGSDANLTASMGIPTLDGLGPIGAGFHSEDEYLLLDSIAPRIELLKRVLTRLAA
ncbi:MAG: M20 family metallopeptidase [Aeromonas sp.]